MKTVIMEICKKRKGILQTILDNHREVWMYRRALNDMLLLLTADKKNTGLPFIQRYEDEDINEVIRLIKLKNDLLSVTKVATTSE